MKIWPVLHELNITQHCHLFYISIGQLHISLVLKLLCLFHRTTIKIIMCYVNTANAEDVMFDTAHCLYNTRIKVVHIRPAEMLEERDALKVALWMLNLCGQHPKHDRVLDRILWIAYVISLIIMCPCIIIELAANYTNVDILASTVESMMTFYQVYFRLILIKRTVITPCDAFVKCIFDYR